MKKIILLTLTCASLQYAQAAKFGGIAKVTVGFKAGHDKAACPGETCYGIGYSGWTHTYGITTSTCHIACMGDGSKCDLTITLGKVAIQTEGTEITNMQNVSIGLGTFYTVDLYFTETTYESRFDFPNRSIFIPEAGAYMNIEKQTANSELDNDGDKFFTVSHVSFTNDPKY